MVMRFLFLLLFLAPAGIASAQGSPQEAIAQPNILWIVGENFALDLGCYGAPNVETPNLDRLAGSGARFTRVYSTSPVCAPSRSALMTGWYATTTDMHNMRSHRDDDYRLPRGVRPITHLLADAGYHTANITHIGERVVGTGKLDLNFVNEGPVYAGKEWSELKQKQPFFAQINMPEAEYDIYDRKSAEKPRVKWVGEEWHPKVATAENVTPPPYYPDHPVVREEWARYLNSVTGTDVRIGWILDQLEKDGLAENTIVVFFADNGRLEARGIHWCFDSGLHVPMIISYPETLAVPRQVAPGKVNRQVLSLLDLTATTLFMAGIEKPVGMQSRVFLGPDAEPPRQFAFAARDRIDETVVWQRSVHGARYHYIRNGTPGAGFLTLNRYKEKCFLVKPLMRQMHAEGKLSGPAADLMEPFTTEMLFDTQADPHEVENLVESGKARHQRVLAEMRLALDSWIVSTGDRGYLPEAEGIVLPFVKEMHDWFGTPSWYKEPTENTPPGNKK